MKKVILLSAKALGVLLSLFIFSPTVVRGLPTTRDGECGQPEAMAPDGIDDASPEGDNCKSFQKNEASEESNLSRTYIDQLRVGMKDCFQKLGATNVSHKQLERWAVLIHDSMSQISRNYHSVQHVFDLAQDQTDPILILSAYFHDLVYHQVDGGFTEEQDRILANVFTQEGSDVYLS